MATLNEMMNELGSFFFDPPVVLVVATVSSILLAICMVCGAWMRHQIDELSAIELHHVERKLEQADALLPGPGDLK